MKEDHIGSLVPRIQMNGFALSSFLRKNKIKITMTPPRICMI
jgi:hypothetical protein